MCQQQKNCSSATLATLHLLLRYPGSTRNRRTCRLHRHKSYVPLEHSSTYLGLFRLLLFLLSLGLCDGRNSLLVADSSGLVAPGSDSGKVSTNDTTLVLHGPARTLLSDFLGDTLLVHAAIDLCPCDLTWVLALEEQGRVLGTSESENLYGKGRSGRKLESGGDGLTLESPRTKSLPLEGYTRKPENASISTFYSTTSNDLDFSNGCICSRDAPSIEPACTTGVSQSASFPKLI